MKLLHFLLLLPVAALSQNISVVSAEKMNVVYRGVDNPIKIAVPGAKSFIATATGMRATDEAGKYIITPGSGVEVKIDIEAQMEDGTTLLEEKLFRIKGLPYPTGTINGSISHSGTFGLSTDELVNAEIGLEMVDFLFDVNFVIRGFTVSFPEKKRFKPIYVEGNKISYEVIKIIRKLKSGDVVVISQIKWGDPLSCGRPGSPIAIVINGDRFQESK